MNPCPCGWRGDPNGRCRCTPEIAARYLRKLSGPLLDRIDIQIEIPALTPAELSARSHRAAKPARSIARAGEPTRATGNWPGKAKPIASWADGKWTRSASLDAAGEALLREAGERFGWSARAYYRVLKVARTIADLAGAAMPTAAQIAEAIQYRRAFAVGMRQKNLLSRLDLCTRARS